MASVAELLDVPQLLPAEELAVEWATAEFGGTGRPHSDGLFFPDRPAAERRLADRKTFIGGIALDTWGVLPIRGSDDSVPAAVSWLLGPAWARR